MTAFTKHHDPGFTLIELMIAIAILGTLAAIASPMAGTYIDRARIAKAKAEIRMIAGEITSFSVTWDRMPNDLAELGLGGLHDPYGNPYRYQPVILGKNGRPNIGDLRKDRNLVPVNTDYDLYSMGKDGKSQLPFTAKNSRDDIVRANNGLFIGLVSAY
ncbi:type IV pilin protein [Desulfatiferula olefinivorans]